MPNAHDVIQGEAPPHLSAHLLWQRLTNAAPHLQPWLSGDRMVSPAPSDPDEWLLLFNAIKHRLRDAVDGTQHPRWNERVQGWMQSLVQDCETALGQLQLALDQEHARRWQLESDAADAQADLAQLRVELAGSRAGEMRARHQALHDSLTLLPNRHHFRLSLAHAIELATRQGDRSGLAVFFVDLDGFKAINDAHGHAAGDELLAIVAARLARALRSNDVVGRMGGDEFACLLRDIREPGQLSRLACKVHETVSAPIKIGDLLISVRPSIGVSMFPQGGLSSDALLKSADEAMYRAKREQTGHAFYEGPARVMP